jgi:hypothetical protein
MKVVTLVIGELAIATWPGAPQGLKPTSFQALTARLKAAPFQRQGGGGNGLESKKGGSILPQGDLPWPFPLHVFVAYVAPQNCETWSLRPD